MAAVVVKRRVEEWKGRSGEDGAAEVTATREEAGDSTVAIGTAAAAAAFGGTGSGREGRRMETPGKKGRREKGKGGSAAVEGGRCGRKGGEMKRQKEKGRGKRLGGRGRVVRLAKRRTVDGRGSWGWGRQR